jgi:hypothetical protein
MLIFLIALTFLSVALFYFLGNFKIENPLINLLRPLFPSWKFFDESINTPTLLIRNEFTTLEMAYLPPDKKWWNIFINPESNFYLCFHSQIQQLLGDLNEFDDASLDDFKNHSSYLMINQYAKMAAINKNLNHYQFKISYVNKVGLTDFEISDDVLISPLLKIQRD